MQRQQLYRENTAFKYCNEAKGNSIHSLVKQENIQCIHNNEAL